MNYIISIINPDSLSILMDLCNQLDLPLSITMAGRGTAVQSMLDLLGIESNERRIVFTVASEEKTKKLIQAQKRHMHIGVPGHGIVIAVPIKSVGGGKTVAFLNGETDNAAYTPSLNYAHELIVAVCSQGCTDMVMNAARAAGARGGTVLAHIPSVRIVHGKGTGANGAPKFYNITIAQEKEMILIVAAASQKTAIMQSILKKAGPDSKAGTIVFSLPTTQVAGFALLDNQDET